MVAAVLRILSGEADRKHYCNFETPLAERSMSYSFTNSIVSFVEIGSKHLNCKSLRGIKHVVQKGEALPEALP